MDFVRTWLIPRVAFWVIWTAWLWCVQTFLASRLDDMPRYGVLLFIVGPPMLIAWIGSRLAKNSMESPNALFWKGAALSCLLGAFADLSFLTGLGWEVHVLLVATLGCGYLSIRNAGVKKMTLTQGELFDCAQSVARRSGVSVTRVLVFTSPKNLPSAFAQRNTRAILLSDRLLRLLSRRETEAVMAHEAAHLRHSQRIQLAALPLLASVMIVVGTLWPEARIIAPFMPIVALLLWRALLRMQEYDADASAIRATADPEALIVALTRVSAAAGLPLHWGWVAGLFMPHPPMSARFRSIARKAGIDSTRVANIVAAAGVIPALPGFTSPFGDAQLQSDTILSVHRKRLGHRMMLFSRVFPVLAGVAITAVERFKSPDLLTLIVHTAGWTAAAMVLFWACYECLVGSERSRLRKQLADKHGYFVGLGTAAEPRQYEGQYHYDLGVASINNGLLNFAGTRCSFAIPSSEDRRVWKAKGPPHYTPRKIVCIEYQRDDGTAAVVSLQSLERWFWPATSFAARQLFAMVTEWSKIGDVHGAPSVPPPQVPGAALIRVGLGTVLKSMKIPCLVSLSAGWFVVQIGSIQLEAIQTAFVAPLVTGILILFTLAPSIDWSQAQTRARSDQFRRNQDAAL